MLNFIYTYSYWHYTSAVRAFFLHIQTLMSFLWRFFGIPDLLMTLFSPWRRLQESYEKGFDIKEKLATFIINSLMRFVGAGVRLLMTLFGVIVIISAFVLVQIAFITWILLPAVIGVLLVLLLDIFI